jgi:hypothetical protein
MVRVDGSKENLNSMGVGAVVRVYAAEHVGDPNYLLGRHDIAIGTGYASGDEAVAHFGLGRNDRCDVEVRWGKLRLFRRQVAANQSVTVKLE